MMESGEPLAGRRSEVMSTSRESHRVASRTLDLERRLRVLSARAFAKRLMIVRGQIITCLQTVFRTPEFEAPGHEVDFLGSAGRSALSSTRASDSRPSSISVEPTNLREMAPERACYGGYQPCLIG